MVRRMRAIAGVMCAVMAAAALAAQPPARQPTIDEVRTAVQRLGLGTPKRNVSEELRRGYPALMLIDALVAAIGSDPAFASGTPARLSAYELLGRVGESTGGVAGGAVLSSDKQVDQLVAGLKEADPQIRGACAGALARVGESRRASVVDPLAAVLDDSSSTVSQRALISLAGLKLRREAPAQVREVAFAPTAAMRERWRSFDREAQMRNAALAPQELSVREAAMNVIASWEGPEVLLGQDLSKDETGRGARAVSIGRRILQDRGRLDLDDARHKQVIGELAELLRQPGPARDADRGAAMALAALSLHGKSDDVRNAAKQAITGALEAAPEAKKGVIRDARAQAR